jgi:hypothetical protein
MNQPSPQKRKEKETGLKIELAELYVLPIGSYWMVETIHWILPALKATLQLFHLHTSSTLSLKAIQSIISPSYY